MKTTQSNGIPPKDSLLLPWQLGSQSLSNFLPNCFFVFPSIFRSLVSHCKVNVMARKSLAQLQPLCVIDNGQLLPLLYQEFCFHLAFEIKHDFKQLRRCMNSMKLVIPLHSLYWSIHTKDESKRGSAFVFIFGVN